MRLNPLNIIIAALPFAFSCTDDGLSRENAGKQKPVVTIEANNVSNYLMTFTVTSDFTATQFGYAVLDKEGASMPAAQSIVMGEVGTALQSGVFSTTDNTKVRIEFECSPDKDYVVYASAITGTGLLSEVESLDIHVNDTEIPEMDSNASVSGNVLTITFSEDIFVNTGSYALIQYLKWGALEVTPQEELPLEYITTEGNRAIFNCPKPGNGAGYIVSFPQGLFMDRSGNMAKGVNSSFDMDTYTFKNLGWLDTNVDFTIEDGYFGDGQGTSWQEEGAEIRVVFPFDVYKNENVENAVSVVYNEAARKEYVYADYNVDDDLRTVRIRLPRAPKATFDVKFSQWAVYDEWGNGNAEYELSTDEFKYAAIDLKTGDYKVKSENGEFIMTIGRSTAATVTAEADWFNLGKDVIGGTGTIMPMLQGSVDYEKRTISFDGSWIYRGVLSSYSAFGNAFYYYGKDESRMLVFWGGGSDGKEPVTISFDETGLLTDISEFDYSVHYASGSFISVYDSVSNGSELTFTE